MTKALACATSRAAKRAAYDRLIEWLVERHRAGEHPLEVDAMLYDALHQAHHDPGGFVRDWAPDLWAELEAE